jgi:hypothetical protein
MANNPHSSRLRQTIRETDRQRARHLDELLDERGPMIGGSYVLQPGRCGKPSCRCARGEYHSVAALYRREQGAATCTYVPLADRQRVEKFSSRYRAFRRARAQVAKLSRRVLELADTLQQGLMEPYPPADRARRRRATRRRLPPRPRQPG